MSYRLKPQILNDPFQDPVLYMPFQFEKRALLCDLGTIDLLSPAQLRQISDIFISHTHMDHFAGFDLLLRGLLRQNMRLSFYGPSGLREHISHHLKGYSWNLAEPGPGGLEIRVHEIVSARQYRCQKFRFHNRFDPGPTTSVTIQNGLILSDLDITVRMAILDHKLPCLAYRIEESPQYHIQKDRLVEQGLLPGRWLNTFRRALHDQQPGDVLLPIADGPSPPMQTLKTIKDDFTLCQPGKVYAYVVDCQFNQQNIDRLLPLIHKADTLFIEAGFRQQDADIAWERYHLTTEQAGFLAGQARVGKVEPLHFSHRYIDQKDALIAEVNAAFAASLDGRLILSPPPSD